jgi:hypothetical protein
MRFVYTRNARRSLREVGLDLAGHEVIRGWADRILDGRPATPTAPTG